MKTTLRFAALLLAWGALGQTAAWAANPVASNVTNNVNGTAVNIPDANGRTLITNLNVADPDGNPTLAFYRFVTLPTSGTLYAYNQASGAAVQITSAGQQVNPFQYPNLLFDPVDGGAATVTFTFAGVDNTGAVSGNATYTINVINSAQVNQLPLTRELTSQNLINTAGATLLQAPLTAVDPDGTIASFNITALPTAAQGVLALDGNAITLNQSIAAADAARITFDPVAGFFGNVTFRYAAVDNNGGVDASPAFYSIPVGNAGCADGNVLNFYGRTELEDWTTARTANVEGVTVTAGSYTSPGGTALRIEDNPTMPGKALVWTADYPNNATNKSSSITYNFNRALTGFTLSLGDIDLATNAWIDQIKLEGYTANNTLVTLSANDVRVGNAATYSGNNIITGTTGSSTADANTVVTWPQAITRVVVTYSNTTTVADPIQQVVTIESMSWCALADVATTLTGPATLSPGASSAAYTVTYANNGPDDAVSTTRTVSIPANAVSAVTAPGGTVTGSQAGGWTITYPGGTYASGNSVSYNFAITPLSTYTGNLTVTSNTGTATSQSSTTNDQATVTLNVAPVADVTVSLAGPTTLYAGQPTGTYTATFTNEGPNTATAVTRTVTLPAGATLTSAQQDAIRAAYPTASFPSATTINFGSVASLANDASSTVTFAFTAPATIGNSLTLAANTGNGVSQGANLAPDQAALTLGTVAVADVRAAISATLTNATTGTFNVTFSNNDQLTAAGVAYTVQLPAGLNVGLNVVTASNSGTYDNTTGLVTYPTAATTLAANGSFASAISYPLANSQGMPVTATARVSTTSDEAGRQGNNVAVATMAPSFDLTTTLSGSATAVAGSPTTLFVTTTNNGTNQAGNATQTVNIGANLNNVYVTNGGTYDRNTGVVTFPTLLNLPAGQTVTNSISFTAPSGNFTPTAAVSTTSPNETTTSNNSAALNGVVGTGVVVSPATASAANVATSIATTSTVVAPGASVTYSVTATNNGPVAATNVVERVQLLPGLTTGTLQVSGTTGVLTGNVITFGTAATYNTTTGVLQYATVNTLSVGATQSFANITVTAPANTGNNGQLLATASVASTTSDNVPADNVASVTVKVNTKAEVATVVNGPSSTTAGLPVTYSVSFTSGGAADAANVVETAQLPAGLSNVVVTDATGAVVANAYNSTTGLVTFPALAADAVGATQTFSIQLVAPGQNFQVISAIRSVTADGTVLNNTAQQSTAVTANADLAVAISGPEVSVIGNAVTYVVTTTNNGPTTATSVVPTLQLPAGLTLVAQSSGSTYTTGTGLLTFGTTATLLPGTSVVNYVTFTMPANPTGGLISGVASASTATTDAVSSNNTAALTTSVAPATVEVANMLTSISVSSNPVPAGSTITYTIAYRNDGSGSGVGSAATDVVPTASLPAGLSASTLQVGGSTGTQSGDIITFSNVNVNGATYNVKTGLLTFPTIASAAASTSANASYTVSFPAPNGGQLVVTSQVASATSDNVLSNNTATSSVTINTSYDVTTLLAGPATALAGSTNTYTVTTLNNGASATSTATTQTVTLPAGVTATNISGNGSQTGSVITWTVPLGQTAGATNEVVNTFSLTMPNSGSLTLTAAVNNANDSNTGNNSATLTTAQANLAPVAQNVWNTLQSVRGNTAGTLLISALNASDADGSITSYTIVTLPLASQGVLYYNGSLATAGQVITDATKLSFDADAAFVGNATFSYLATDNLGQTSPAALYTIPVAQDQNSTYASTPVKGGATPYQNGDLIASTFDVNTGSYSLSGSTAVVNKNGIGSAVLATGSNPLPAGLALDAVTGAITVADRTKLVTGNYTVIIVTVDANGGTNSVQVPLTIGTRPLPVELVEFAAKTQNADALLTWKTAQEKNNDRFEVERSTDGVRFEKVGQVAGHGTTSAPQTYAYTDANAGTLATQVYYRLKQVDRDGTTAYSPVRTVAFGKELGQNGIALYPNPAHDELSVSLGATAPNATLEVYTVNGMFVRKQSFGAAATTKLNVSTLPQGTYLLKVTTATGTVLTSRFVKH